MDNTTDSVIIGKVLAGNTAAYSLLVDKYKNKVFTLAYNIICKREEAEEIAQDAFVKAFTALKSFKQQSLFSTWLYRIVVNTALNKRKEKKFILVDTTEEIDEEESYDHLNLFLQQEETSNIKKFIQQALRELRDEERICITLFYLNELPVADIHELTSLTAANIKVLLHRGRKHLYEQLTHLLGKEMNNLL